MRKKGLHQWCSHDIFGILAHSCRRFLGGLKNPGTFPS
ncbi:hypothetical protein D1BOALGB6SA_406 [Olavius sp. associated proteobacterium Delta 1]|nr:hypothetical protein D1BOALGB6SA_406 [Olavius sp. associated proteobacterium Delta 1]